MLKDVKIKYVLFRGYIFAGIRIISAVYLREKIRVQIMCFSAYHSSSEYQSFVNSATQPSRNIAKTGTPPFCVHGWWCFAVGKNRWDLKRKNSSPSLTVTWLLFTLQHELCDWLLGGLTAWMALGRMEVKKEAEIIWRKNKDEKKKELVREDHKESLYLIVTSAERMAGYSSVLSSLDCSPPPSSFLSWVGSGFQMSFGSLLRKFFEALM